METLRLIIRRFEERDLLDLYEYVSDPEVLKFEPYSPKNLDETREDLEWRINCDEMLAVELKETGKLIGNIYLGKRNCNSLELGYVFNKSFWGYGYATEACQAIIKDSFLKGTHRIYAMCDILNPSSWKLLERLGFVREGYLKENVYFHVDENGNPIWKDTCIYSLLNKK